MTQDDPRPESRRDSRFEELASRFLEHHRRGEPIDVESIAREHPDLAPRILALFPSLLLLERLKSSGGAAPVAGESVADAPSRPLCLGGYELLGEVGRGWSQVVGSPSWSFISRMIPCARESSRKSLNSCQADGRLSQTK